MADGRPLISIIIANFNSGAKLHATWESVRAQAADFECLIVDGASRDESLTIARGLAEADPRVRLVSEPDKGVYDAMNKGVALARGSYVYFLGAGDELFDGALAEMSPHLQARNPMEIVYGDVLMSGRRFDGVFTYRKLCDHNVCHQAVFYGRDVFAKCGGYDLKYKGVADWTFNLKCFAAPGVTTRYVPVMISRYEGGGISERGDDAFDRDRRRNIREFAGTRALLLYEWDKVAYQVRRVFRVLGRLARFKSPYAPPRAAAAARPHEG